MLDWGYSAAVSCAQYGDSWNGLHASPAGSSDLHSPAAVLPMRDGSFDNAGQHFRFSAELFSSGTLPFVLALVPHQH